MSGPIHSRLEVEGKKPTAAEIGVAEIAINMEDGIPYTKKSDGTVIPIGGASLIVQNNMVLNDDFVLKAGIGGVVTSGFTIGIGVSLEIEDSSVMSVV